MKKVNPLPKAEFVECDTCRAKAGSPQLCGGCVLNRQTIWVMQARIEKLLSPLSTITNKEV